jgi:hypothetical protein
VAIRELKCTFGSAATGTHIGGGGSGRLKRPPPMAPVTLGGIMTRPDEPNTTTGNDAATSKPAENVAELRERYEILIDDLRRVKEGPDAVADDLASGLNAIISIRRFLAPDVRVLGEALDHPIRLVAEALNDTLHGGKPALFARKGRRGRPMHQSQDAIKATLAAAMSISMQAGKNREESAKEVAIIARNYSIKMNNIDIDYRQISRWRDEMNGRASALRNDIYKSILDVFQSSSLSPLDSQSLVEGIMKQLRGGGI